VEKKPGRLPKVEKKPGRLPKVEKKPGRLPKVEKKRSRRRVGATGDWLRDGSRSQADLHRLQDG